MDVDHIKELHRKGIQIGSHSVSNKNFLKLTKTHSFFELQESKDVLEEITGNKITGFSFPYVFLTKIALCRYSKLDIQIILILNMAFHLPLIQRYAEIQLMRKHP